MQRYLSYFRDIRHHKRRLIFVLIPLVILGFIFWPRPQKLIETQVVKQGDIVESLSATGNVDATSVSLNFLSGGKLVYLGIKKGDHVKAGQTIATLDQRTVQKNLEDKLRDYSKTRNDFDQTKVDNKDKVLSGDLQRVLQNNQYDLEKAIISVELQDLARQQAILTTPIAGVVTKADVQTAGVNVGATTTFTIADLSNITFNIDIDEADVGKVVIGQKVKVTLDAFPDETLIVSVKSIDYAAHATSTGGNVYTVAVTLPDTKKFDYRIGMNGDAEIITNEKKNVIIAPLSSVVDDEYVYVKTKKSFEKRKVTLGLQNDTNAEIKSGLTAGEEVAIDPTEAEKVSKK